MHDTHVHVGGTLNASHHTIMILWLDDPYQFSAHPPEWLKQWSRASAFWILIHILKERESERGREREREREECRWNSTVNRYAVSNYERKTEPLEQLPQWGLVAHMCIAPGQWLSWWWSRCQSTTPQESLQAKPLYPLHFHHWFHHHLLAFCYLQLTIKHCLIWSLWIRPCLAGCLVGMVSCESSQLEASV